MEIGEVEEALKVLDSSLIQIKWRLRFQSKRRLRTDILALLTRMRPVIMVDYGGKMPELQEHLCALLKHCQQESAVFEHVRVMVIEDMIYLIHLREFTEYLLSSLNSEVDLLFVDLEQDPPKMVAQGEKSLLIKEFIRVQKLFSEFFSANGPNNYSPSCHTTDCVASAESSAKTSISSQSYECLDLSSCMQDTQVTVPTLNGWLLGYPVVYLFSKEHIADAIYNLSTKFLHIFRILVQRKDSSGEVSQAEELMSFSVPYELSMGGCNERWAKSFLNHMLSKWGKCKQTWRSLEMEVTEFNPQAVVL